MKPRMLVMIDTYAIGGPGKLILQFLKNGGREHCFPIVAGFWRGPDRKWQFREAVEAIGVRFETLRQKFAIDPMAIKSAYLLARENNIQLLESHGYKAHVVCLVLSKLLQIPWVAYIHGWTSENLKIELYNQLEKKLIRYADRIIPVSQNLGMRLQLNEHDAKKVVNIQNAADPVDLGHNFTNVREELAINDDELLLAVVGRLSPEKGHHYLLEALPSLIKIHPKVKVVFVGEGQERTNLLSIIQRLSLKDTVKLVGYQEEVSSYFNACDLLVMPSLSEGMPMAALEAMMFAKPVVASQVGGIPEVVLHGVTGVLVAPANPLQLADALIDLLNNRQQMIEFGHAGKKRVAGEFDAEQRVKQIVAMYQSLLISRREICW